MRATMMGLGLALGMGGVTMAQQMRPPPEILVRIAADALRHVARCERGAPPTCQQNYDTFTMDYGRARIGDIDAQRRLSAHFLLGVAPIRRSHRDACVWAGMVVGRTRPNVSGGDGLQFNMACMSLPEAELDLAQRELNEMVARVNGDIAATLAAGRR